jgi:PAS domain S-box-containing protein
MSGDGGESIPAFLAGGGETGALMRRHDWSDSPLNTPETWPQSLRSVVGLILSSKFPMFVAWGSELGFLYNDAYAEILGAKHPRALGRRFFDIWSEIWPDISPLIDAALAGEATFRENLPLVMNRRGFDEETWFTFSYSPVRDESGTVAGMFCACAETTAEVRATKRREALLMLDERLKDLDDARELSFVASQLLGEALGATRVGYGVVDSEARTIEVQRNWDAAGATSVVGRHRFRDYGGYVDELLRGETVAVVDVDLDHRTSGQLDRFRSLGVGAFLDVPVIEHGHMAAVVFVHSATPRVWTSDEIAFVREVAVRMRADIARREAERALRGSEEKFRQLAETIDQVFYVADLDPLRILYLSPAYERIWGRPAHDLVADTRVFLESIHPEDRERVAEFATLQQAGEAFEVEYRIVRPDGGIRVIHDRAFPVRESGSRRYVGAAEDVTERRQALARFEGVFNSDLMGFTIFDLTTGETLAINDRFLAMTGHTRADFEEGRWDWREFTTPEHLERDAGAVLEARQRGWWRPYEKEYRRRDGSVFPARLASAPLPGEPGRVVVSIEDISERRAADEALRASEAVARARAGEIEALFDAAPVGLCVFDREMRYVRINERLAEMNGIPAADHVGRTVREIVPDLDEQAIAAMARVLDGERLIGLEVVGKTPALPGVVRTWRENFLPLRNASDSVVGIIVSAEEITEAKRAETALRESEEFTRRILESSADCIKVVSFDGRVDFISDASSDLLELSHPRDVLGTMWTDLWPEAERPKVLAALDEGKAGRTARFEGRAPTAKGNPRWWDVAVTPICNAAGEPERLLAVSRDVTPTREAQERLRELAETLEQRVVERTAELTESQRRFRSIFDSAFQFMALLAPDGTVLEVNRTALAWSEIEAADIIGLAFWRAAPMRDDPALQAAVEGEIRRAARGETVRAEHVMRGARDVRATIDFSLKPVLDDAGAVVSIVAEGRDITALKQTQEALRQSQKMEAIGQLTGGVAHDFNNLLTPIVGTLDLLQRKKLGGEREQRLVAGAALSADRARTLVQRLLAFARQQPLQSIPVDIAALVSGMGELVASTTGPQIRVVVDAPSDLPAALAAPNQIEMALLNLAVNARDAMPDGGTLRITASADRVGPGHRTRLEPDVYLRISVADTGAGMDEATVARAVEPFFSTKGVGRGTGLGLSMVHGLALQLGGALVIESRRGLGTNVELWIPRCEHPAEPSRSAADDAAPVARAGTVLLVDDEFLVRTSTADMLTELGYTVLEASSAAAALRMIDRGDAFDILVTDHLMPGMNGVDLVRAVRARRPDVRALLVSGYSERELVVDVDLPRLTKPYREEELAASLARLVAQGSADRV